MTAGKELSEGASPRRRLPRWAVPAFGYLVSIACLIWVYYGFDWRAEWARLLATDWRWVYPAVAADLLVYIVQGWRWSVLLRPLADVSVVRSTQAVYIGLFANEVLPFRSGEIVRCYLVRRWTRLPLSVVLSSAVIERMLDGYWLLALFWFFGGYVALPALLVHGTQVVLGVLVVVGALVAVASVYGGHAREAVSRSRWAKTLRRVVDGVHDMGRSWSFLWAAMLSSVYLGLQVLPIYYLLWAYGMDLPFWAAGVILVVLRVGTIVPLAPGNVGSFQALTVLGLGLCGVERQDAAGFATLLFVVVTVPLWLGGFVALLATRMRIEEIHRDAHRHFGSEK